MFNLDQFTKTVFDDIREGVPIIGTDCSSDLNHVGFLHSANGLASHHLFPDSSLLSSASSAVTSEITWPSNLTDVNEGLSWDTIVPQIFPQRPNHLRRTPQDVPLAATPGTWTVGVASFPPPPVAHAKRRIDDSGPSWYASKRGRLNGMNAIERVPPSTHSYTGFSGFTGTHNDIEGNALRLNNNSTRTSDCEEFIIPVGGSVPVAEQSSTQGLWPAMTSTAASQRRPAWTPFTTAEYGSQPFPLPIATQTSGTLPGTSAQVTSVPAMEYEFDFSWPSTTHQPYAQDFSQALTWGHAQQPPRRPVQIHRDEMSFPIPGPSSFPGSLRPGPSSAVEGYAFPSILTPSMAAGNGHDSSHASGSQQRPNQGRPMAQQSRRVRRQQHTRQTRRTSSQPSESLLTPATESSPSGTSQASSASPASASTSTPAPKKGKKKAAQMPFSLAKVKCYLCREGFRRGSELHDHWETNKHRLRKLQEENPGVAVTVAHLIPNCFCPSCGKGYTTQYIVTRHLKTCRGRTGSTESVSQDGEGGSSGSTAQV